METGWLLDDGRLCIGASWHGFLLCNYTDRRVIRFARREDAELFRRALAGLGSTFAADRCLPVEHQFFTN